MNDCTFIILGATGDLAKRKLIPAVYQLIKTKKLQKFALIGAAYDEATVDSLLESCKEFIGEKINPEIWDILKESTHYRRLDFNKIEDFINLNTYIEELEKKENLSGSRLVYLASAASYYCKITEYLASSGIVKKKADGDPWYRIVYEKPFGHDLESAHIINLCIEQFLFESQAYRIDHYLTKEMVTNIVMMRFTNLVFEPLWNNHFIDSVEIILSEDIGLEGRGAYYDSYGALCDVVQNHMLELMALVAMEAPEKLEGDYIRNERAKVLQKIRPVDGILGQYEGYKSEKNVAPDSRTETFAALTLMIDNPRWENVPFYLKTGKRLNKKETVIHIKFKKVECLFTKNCPSDSNYLTMRLFPDESFILTLNAKGPNSDVLIPVAMEYCHSCVFGASIPSAHEVLIEEVCKGEQSVSVRFDEIEYAWKIIDAIREKKLPLYIYAQGSQGPTELEEFSKKHGMRWRS